MFRYNYLDTCCNLANVLRQLADRVYANAPKWPNRANSCQSKQSPPLIGVIVFKIGVPPVFTVLVARTLCLKELLLRSLTLID